MNQTEWFFLYFVNFPPLIWRQFPVPPPYTSTVQRWQFSTQRLTARKPSSGRKDSCHQLPSNTNITVLPRNKEMTQLLISLWSNFSIRKIIYNFSLTTYHIYLQSCHFAFMPRCRRSVIGVQTVYNTKPKKLDSISRQWPRLPGKPWKLAVVNYAEPCCLATTH